VALLLAGIFGGGASAVRGNHRAIRSCASRLPASVRRPCAPWIRSTMSRLPSRGSKMPCGNGESSPLEPLNIRTADFEPAEFEDLPMTAEADSLESTVELGIAEREAAAGEYVRVPTLRMNDAVAMADTDPGSATPISSTARNAPAAPPPQAQSQPQPGPQASSPPPESTPQARMCARRSESSACGYVRWVICDGPDPN